MLGLVRELTLVIVVVVMPDIIRDN